MPYTLRADIKLPPKINGRTRYPFFKMKVGESFAVPLDEVSKVRVNASLYGKEHRMKFAVRRIDPMDKTSAYRCWRLK